jgi:hypothetical protein
MVDCPECGKPLKKDSNKGRFYCENECCIVVFVCHPYEPNKTRITYTGFASYKASGLHPKEPNQRSIKPRLKLS